MKKIFTIIAAAMTAMTMSAAHSLNNPVGDDGRYIVKYDLATNTFAEANDMKVNETFVFAVDVTGTWLETFLNGTPTAEGAQRGIAITHWTNLCDFNGDASRMKRISGNIWGMTVNYWQIATGDFSKFSKALMKDGTFYVSGYIFGFEYTKDTPRANWFMWEDQPVDVTQAEGSDCLFAFALSTETTAQEGDEEFYSTDYMEDMYGYNVKGYAAPCAKIGTDILVHNLTGWDNLLLYMWGEGGNDLGGAWPGFAAQREDEGDLIFLVAEGEYDGKRESLIFNNGNGLQLADYPITLGDSYELWVTLDGVFDAPPAPVWPEDAPTTAPAAPTVDGASILGAALTTSYAFEPLDWPGAMPKLLTFETGETIYYMEKMTWQIYTNLDEESYDVSEYNMLHIDLYPATGTEIKIAFEALDVNTGDSRYKNGVVKTLTAGQWNGLDIALSEFPALASGDPYDFSDIKYFYLEGYNAEQTALTVGNVYFYSDPTALPKVDGTGITVNGRKYGFPVRLVKEVK